jgi:F-type H+-transporting ATPase subunit epsilon
MRLLITTPTALVVDDTDVRHVRAEDETGAFGILPGHTDFLTVLAISVISWRDGANTDHHVAVRGGMLTVRDGDLVEVATRDAVLEDSLEKLGDAVLDRFREDAQVETEARTSSARLQLATMRQLHRFLESARVPVSVGGPPQFGSGFPDRGGDGDA